MTKLRCDAMRHIAKLGGAAYVVWDAAMGLTSNTPDQRVLYASNRYLAVKTGLTERTVGAVRARLCKAEWFESLDTIEQWKTGNNGKFETKKFRVIQHEEWAAKHPGQCTGLVAPSSVDASTVEPSTVDLELFHTPAREAWATIPIGNHRENWPVKSRDFELWIMKVLFEALGGPPKKSLVREYCEMFEMLAICKSPTKPTFLRLAKLNDLIYFDMGDDDWRAIEISAEGWRIVSQPPVKFWRLGIAALPLPTRDGGLGSLVEFLNIAPASLQLLLTWLN